MIESSTPPFNAFARLNLPEDFDLCPQQLERHYEEAQSQIHPDQWGSELGKQLAQRLSLECTQAYGILRLPEKRAQHLLQWHGHWPMPAFPDLFEVLMHWHEHGEHPQALSASESRGAFARAWAQGDVEAAQRAYWWMMTHQGRGG